MSSYTPQIFDKDIDPTKTVENPGLISFAHTVGGAVIRPEDEGKIKTKALTSMRQQTAKQLAQIQKQAELLMEQAKKIQERVEISEKIYNAQFKFDPVVGEVYYLYLNRDQQHVLSLISPDAWNTRASQFEKCLAEVQLLADHTWDVLQTDFE